jgi:hypothetical protein
MSGAKCVPGEGSLSAETNPSPGSPSHPRRRSTLSHKGRGGTDDAAPAFRPATSFSKPIKQQTRLIIPAALSARVMLISRALINDEGTGKAGCRPHPRSACKQKARGRTTGTSRIIRPSLREWLYGLYVLSPGTGVLAPVTAMLVKASQAWPQHREARTTRLHRAQLVFVRAIISRNRLRPSHSLSNVRDDAYVPHPDRNARSIRLIC